MVYFGENDTHILAECETCKREQYIARSNIADASVYEYRLTKPVKCFCGAIDERVRRDKQSTYEIRSGLSQLVELLKKQAAAEKNIENIKTDINKQFNTPPFANMFLADLLFTLKTFFISLGVGIAVEILALIICGIMFFGGATFDAQNLAAAANLILYNVNIFKSWGAGLASTVGFADKVPPLNNEIIADQFILDYLPHAICGIVAASFYIMLIVGIIRLIITLTRLGIHIYIISFHKHKIKQKKEEFDELLLNYSNSYDELSEQIKEFTILPVDYVNLKAVSMILEYFNANRVDTIREAVNLYHAEDKQNRIIAYQRAIYNEARQTKRYTKALYIMTADNSAEVDVPEDDSDEIYDTPAVGGIGELVSSFREAIKKNQEKPVKPAVEASQESALPEKKAE